MALPASLLVQEAIDDAFERIMPFSYDGRTISNLTSLDGPLLISAKRSIRFMLEEWNNDSVLFWRVVTDQSQAITAGDEDFEFPSNVIDILDMAVFRSSAKIPMIQISRTDWFALPDRTNSSGMPTRYWTERNAEPALCHFYPKAENSTDTLIYDAMTFFNDSTSLSGPIDVRRNWNEAFVSGLSRYLAEKFNPARLQEKLGLYGGPGRPGGAYTIAKMGDRERSDTVFVLNKRRRQHR